MLDIRDGIVNNPRIKLKHRLFTDKAERNSISLPITRGPMSKVNGIIVHQTGYLARNTLGSYTNPGSNGAHFLIDLDGTIYQTVAVNRQAYHVGKLRSRCLLEMRCSEAELPDLERWDRQRSSASASNTHRVESAKNHPVRFPSNTDSIGIECVGIAFGYDADGNKLADQSKVKDDDKVYDDLTPDQKKSLEWLIRVLTLSLKVPLTEVFRHPVVSIKNTTEARSAQEIILKLQKESKNAEINATGED
jgi:N-acetyl-anhydromuramyl-L-alanine amidase AmpD